MKNKDGPGHEDLQVFVRWQRFLGWLLGKTEKFPKRVRFTFSSRLDNMALDVLEIIVEAAYTRDKLALLKRANLEIEKMRVLIRICYEQRYLSTDAYEHAVKELYESGRMVGGWIRQQRR